MRQESAAFPIKLKRAIISDWSAVHEGLGGRTGNQGRSDVAPQIFDRRAGPTLFGAPWPALAEDILVTQYKADPPARPTASRSIRASSRRPASTSPASFPARAAARQCARSCQRLGYGETSPAGIISAILEGQDIKIVDIGSRSLADNVIIVMPNSPIKSMADMKGKKFAISNPKSLGEMTAVIAAEKVGLDPKTSSASRSATCRARLRRWKTMWSTQPVIPGILFLTRGGESKYRVIMGPKDLPAVAAGGRHRDRRPDEEESGQIARHPGRPARGGEILYEPHRRREQISRTVYAPLPAKDVDTLMQLLVDAKFYSEGRIEMPLLDNTVRAMKYVGMLDHDADLTKMVDTSFLPTRFAAK